MTCCVLPVELWRHGEAVSKQPNPLQSSSPRKYPAKGKLEPWCAWYSTVSFPRHLFILRASSTFYPCVTSTFLHKFASYLHLHLTHTHTHTSPPFICCVQYARVLLQLIKRVMARVRSSRALKPDGKRGTRSEGDGAVHGETEKTIFQLIDR